MHKNRLEEWAKFIEKKENVNLLYNNPGALKEAGKLRKFLTYEEGWKALIRQLTIACTGQSQYYKPTNSLLQFFEIYAPKWDNNDPVKYANECAQYLKVPVTTQIQELYKPIFHLPIQRILCILLNYETEKEEVIKSGFRKVKAFFDSLEVETEITFECNHIFNPPIISVKIEDKNYSVLNPESLRHQYENLVNGHHFVIISYPSEGGLTPIEFSEAYKGALWGQLPVLDVSDSDWVANFAAHEILHGWYYRAWTKGIQVNDEVHTHAWEDGRKEFNYSDIIEKLRPHISLIFQPIPNKPYIPPPKDIKLLIPFWQKVLLLISQILEKLKGRV